MHSEQFPGPDIKRSLCVYQPSPYGILSQLRQVFQIDYSFFFFLYWACVFKILLEGVRFSPILFFPLCISAVIRREVILKNMVTFIT